MDISEQQKIIPPTNAQIRAAQTRRSAILIGGVMFVAVISYGTYTFSWRAVYGNLISTAWVKTPAVITENQVKKSVAANWGKLCLAIMPRRFRGTNLLTDNQVIDNIARLHLRFKYEYQGQTYRSNDYDFYYARGYSSDLAEIDALAAAYPVNKKIDCWVNPASPATAVIRREIPRFFNHLITREHLIILAIGGIIYLIIRYKFS